VNTLKNPKSKAVHVKITPEVLVEALIETMYFNKKVDKVRVSISKLGDGVPNHNVQISCTGVGRVNGKIVDGVLHGTIFGTEKEIEHWQKFFSDFLEVPEFSLTRYIEWLKTNSH